MPGTYNYPSRPPRSKSPSSLKPFKKLKASMGAPAAEEGEAEAKRSNPASMKKVKVRVICTDPDATDSSSDEDVDVKPSHVRATAHKRVVRELLLPASLALPSSWPGSTGEGCVDAKLPLRRQKRNVRRPFMASCLSKSGNYMGVRQRRCGKWTAEIQDTAQGVEVWLGTYGPPAAAAQAYDDAALNIKRPEADANFVSPRQDCLSAELDASRAGDRANELLTSPSISENADSAGSCFLVNSPPSVLGPDPISPAFFCIPYGSSSGRCFSDAFSDEYSDDSISDEGHKIRESKMTVFSMVSDVASRQSMATMPESADGKAKPGMGAEASILPFPFVDGISCFDELGQFLENDPACISDVTDISVDFHESLADTDMNFELDSEALAWINVPDSWACAM